MVDVKICGLSEPDTLDAALEKGADMVGFVFYRPSPRNVTPAKAGALAARVAGRARKVAVTVDADDALIDAIMSTLAPEFIQAHGRESPERVVDIARRHQVKVIKAIKVRTADDVDGARAYEGRADVLMFDAKAPDDMGEALPGGNGISFDWSLLRAYTSSGRDKGYVLSGGLDAANVVRAVERTGAAIVDVSSGVETAPGVKDARLISNFIEAARRAR